MRFVARLVLAAGVAVAPSRADVTFEAPRSVWRLRTGPVEMLVQPVTGAAGTGESALQIPPPAVRGMVEGRRFTAADLELKSHRVADEELDLLYRLRGAPLEIGARYATAGDTGVVTHELTVTNRGTGPVRVQSLPSLVWALADGDYELTYLHGGWTRERQVHTERVASGTRQITAREGRSSHGHAAWFALHNLHSGVFYACQLAYSGNWQLSVERNADGTRFRPGYLKVELGMQFDNAGPLRLPPGESFRLPSVACTASAGDLDDAANQLHRYQRRFVIPDASVNRPPLVQFNSWYPTGGKMDAAQLKEVADVAAAIGTEVFVVDAGWYSRRDWERELGDYVADKVAFADGLGGLAKYVRGKGMKFGLWTEIENVGIDSRLFKEHPDWLLRRNGLPIENLHRCQLNFAKPEVRAWARTVIDRLMRECAPDWLKIDYNIDVGEEFDGGNGDVLYRHVMGYYKWLDEVRAGYPKLVIENCASGGLRFDLGMLAHTHTTWLSDEVLPQPSLQLGYGCTLEFAQEACNHWMVGDTHTGQIRSAEPEWLDFLFRVPMNGPFGVSSRVFEWTPAMRARAAENIALYKHLRPVLMGSDVYHLTPPPDHDRPTGWMALQYVTPDAVRSVVMAYRLGSSQPTEKLRLRGLAPEREYRVLQGGRPVGTRTGRALASEGLPVTLGSDWRAEVLELEQLR